MRTEQRSLRIVTVSICVAVMQLLTPTHPTALANGSENKPTTPARPISEGKKADGTPIKELIPFKGAEKVRYDKGTYDSLHVAYGLNEKYPSKMF